MSKKIDSVKADMGFSVHYPCCGNCKNMRPYVSSNNPLRGGMFCELGNFYVWSMNWCKKHERK